MTIIACSSSSARMKTKTAGDLLTLSARWWGKQKIDNFLALRARSRTSRTVEFSRKNREKRLWTSYVHSSPVQVCKCVRICAFAFFIREKVMWLKSWSQVEVRLFDCITKWWLLLLLLGVTCVLVRRGMNLAALQSGLKEYAEKQRRWSNVLYMERCWKWVELEEMVFGEFRHKQFFKRFCSCCRLLGTFRCRLPSFRLYRGVPPLLPPDKTVVWTRYLSMRFRWQRKRISVDRAKGYGNIENTGMNI